MTVPAGRRTDFRNRKGWLKRWSYAWSHSSGSTAPLGSNAVMRVDWPGATLRGMSPSTIQRPLQRQASAHRHDIRWQSVHRRRREPRLRRERLAIVPSWCVVLNPVDHQLDLLGRQRLIVPEIAKSLDRSPWRHPPGEHGCLDLGDARLHVPIGHQRERRSVRPVAGRALVVDQTRDFPVPGDGRHADVVRGDCSSAAPAQQGDEKHSSHHRSYLRIDRSSRF